MAMIDAEPADTATSEWLDQLYRHAETGWLTLFSLDRTTGDRRTDWSPATDTGTLARIAAAREPLGCVWFGVALRRTQLADGKRGGTDDCTAIPGLWIDIDIAGPGHRVDHRLARDHTHARQLIDAFPLPPTAVIDTGGGIQAWWLLSELTALDHDTRALLTAWGATWNRLADQAGIDLDNVFDPARVMRLPGTTNRKEGLARPVTIAAATWDRRYGLDDIDQHLDPPPAAPTHQTGPRIPYIGPDRPGDAFNARHSGGDILARAGFTLARTSNGEEHWCRPGKNPRDGTSATVYGDDGHITIWSNTCAQQWPGLPLRRPMDPFWLYVHLEHRGDTGAATRALRALGYGTDQPGDLHDLLGATLTDPEAPTGDTGWGLNLPDQFWEARPELTHIRKAAHARMRSADAVLAVVLARIAAVTAPFVQLPRPVGSAGTLDYLTALIGSSGSGKSSAGRTADELIPIDDDGVRTVPLGSGEGLIEAYFDWEIFTDTDGKKKREKQQKKRAVLAMLDEGQALAEMGGRKGSTLLTTIRSAWSGDLLGQANAAEERRRELKPGTYRFAMVAGFQLEHATGLLDDAAGGTPQRFVFLAAQDPAIPRRPEPWPGPLPWAPKARQAGPLDIDETVADEIAERAWQRATGQQQVDPLDAHRDLVRLKVATLLTLLADRDDVNAEDWALAGVVMDTSDRVRASIVAAAAARAREAEAATRDRLAGRAAHLDDDASTRALQGAARAIARHIHRGPCDGGCKRTCMTPAIASKHRSNTSVGDAIALAVANGWIVPNEQTEPVTYTPGGDRP